jgi:N-acetylmuramoyl-L-alanine amidase
MQQRLYAIGMLDDSLVEHGYFCEFTHTALQEFQANRGLPQDGVCDRNAWDALIEASWLSGVRLLYLTSPHLRGDDVSALQTNLAQLGFDCGRIDGILGPNTVHSLTDFQQNYGLVADGICGPETLRALSRMSSQTGTGPGIVSVRESEKLHQAAKVADSLKIVVGCFGDLQSVSRGLTRTLREQYDNVMTVEETDPTLHATSANSFQADVYVGIAASSAEHHDIVFYQTEGFISPGGRRLAEAIATQLGEFGSGQLLVKGMRLPILRATRMPAVLCIFGQSETPGLDVTTHAISTAISGWFTPQSPSE